MISTAERTTDRTHCRKPIDIRVKFVKLVEGRKETIHGRTRDLSNNGVGVTMAASLRRGEIGTLVMFFPKINLEMNLTAVIQHCRGFRYGMKFVHLSSEQQFLINGICGALPN